ncbi:GNAT family N-acetyltransferase [Amycolatopsis sp. NPDC049691]|uniref:GNAT family N-acetyltransferase n=1 Tax=Amycolatopsis sp. NPDC049691 TaxID=3155155 RepID=UPI003439D86B
MSEYRLRRAREEDLPTLLRILDGAVEWLAGRGTDQWQGARWRAEELSPDLPTGCLRVAEILPAAAATVGASPVGGFGAVAGVALSPASTGVAASGASVASGLRPAATAPAATAGASPALGASPVNRAAAAVAVGTMVLRDTHPADLWLPADDPGSALYLHHLAVDRAFAGRRVGSWLLDQAAVEAGRRGKRFVRLDAWTTNTRLHDYYRGQGFRFVRVAGGTSGALFERAVSPP